MNYDELPGIEWRPLDDASGCFVAATAATAATTTTSATNDEQQAKGDNHYDKTNINEQNQRRCEGNTISTNEQDEQDKRNQLGHLVLSVDFAPPECSRPVACAEAANSSPVPTTTVTIASTDQSASSPSERAASISHLIELSFCVRQQTCPGDQFEWSPQAPSSCDTTTTTTIRGAESDHERRHLPFPSTKRTKRRIIYEKFDKISLEIGRPYQVSTLVAATGATGATGGASAAAAANNNCDPSGGSFPFGQQGQSPAAVALASRLKLPLKSGALDSCLCFNLLNVRVASARLMALEQLAELEAAGQRACCSQVAAVGQQANGSPPGGGGPQPTNEPSLLQLGPNESSLISHHHHNQHHQQHQALHLQQQQQPLQQTGELPQLQTGNQLTKETREELERNWLRMERLTSELRLALLNELARVVRPKGEFASIT